MTEFLFSLIVLCCLCLLYCLKSPNKRALMTALTCHAAFSCLVWMSLSGWASITCSPYTATSIQVVIMLLWLLTQSTHNALNPNTDPASKLIILWCTFEIIVSTTQTAPPTPSRIEALSHPLALLHLTTSMTAKAALLLAITQSLCRLKPPHALVRAALAFQAMAIISGMIWALDAWNALWQWDPIETLSLMTFICLLGAVWQKRSCWYQALLISVMATDLVAAGLFAPAASRHSYASPSLLSASFHIAWAASLLLIHNALDSRKSSFVPLTCSIVIVLLTALTMAGFKFSAMTLSTSLGLCMVIFATYDYVSSPQIAHLKKIITPLYLIIFSVLIITIPYTKTHSVHYTLTPLEQHTSCGQAYLLNIKDNNSEVVVGNTKYQFDQNSIHNFNHCIAGRHIYRLRSHGYDFDKGLQVTLTDVTLNYAWLLLLIALALAAYDRLNAPPRGHEA